MAWQSAHPNGIPAHALLLHVIKINMSGGCPPHNTHIHPPANALQRCLPSRISNRVLLNHWKQALKHVAKKSWNLRPAPSRGCPSGEEDGDCSGHQQVQKYHPINSHAIDAKPEMRNCHWTWLVCSVCPYILGWMFLMLLLLDWLLLCIHELDLLQGGLDVHWRLFFNRTQQPLGAAQTNCLDWSNSPTSSETLHCSGGTTSCITTLLTLHPVTHSTLCFFCFFYKLYSQAPSFCRIPSLCQGHSAQWILVYALSSHIS